MRHVLQGISHGGDVKAPQGLGASTASKAQARDVTVPRLRARRTDASQMFGRVPGLPAPLTSVTGDTRNYSMEKMTG